MHVITSHRSRTGAGVRAQVLAFCVSLALATPAAQMAQAAPVMASLAGLPTAGQALQDTQTAPVSPSPESLGDSASANGSPPLDLYPLEGDAVPLADQDAAQGGAWFVAVINGAKHVVYSCVSKAACQRIIASLPESGGRFIASVSDRESLIRKFICRHTRRLC